MSGDRIAVMCLLGYLAVGIFTFGHSGAARTAWQEQHCRADTSAAARVNCFYGDGGPDAFFAGLFWPLYWSWELQS